MPKVPTPIITLFPEEGMDWGLWSERDDIQREREDDSLQPSDLHLSIDLIEILKRWNRTWIENYGYGVGTSFVSWWREGFDLNSWLQEGLWIAKQIEAEADVTVDRRFAHYLHRPIPLVPANKTFS